MGEEIREQVVGLAEKKYRGFDHQHLMKIEGAGGIRSEPFFGSPDLIRGWDKESEEAAGWEASAAQGAV